MSNGTRSNESRVPSSPREGGTHSNITACVRTFEDIQEQDVDWLCYPLLPRGKPTEISGDPEVGKSSITADWVARLSAHKPFPGETDMERDGPIHCLIVSSEDNPEDTIKPRLRTAGADMNYVHFLDGFRHGDDRYTRTLDLGNEGLVRELEEVIRRYEIGFLVLDPIASYMGDKNTAQDAVVRGVLTPLNKVLGDNDCTLLAVRHLNKDSNKPALYRPGGSVGFTANARVGMLVMKVPESDSDERALLVMKSNGAPKPDPLGYTIQSHEDDPRKSVLAWSKEPPDVDLGDLNSADSTGSGASDRDEAKEWILAMLADGPVASAEVFRRAEAELEVSAKTVKRAKEKLADTPDKVISKKIGDLWYWIRADSPEARGTGDE